MGESLGTVGPGLEIQRRQHPRKSRGELRLLWEEQVETELGSWLPERYSKCGEAEPEATVRSVGPPVSLGLHLTSPCAP